MTDKEFIEFHNSTRQRLYCSLESLQYLANKVNSISSNYDFYITPKAIIRTDINGKAMKILNNKANYYKWYYLYQVECFIEGELENRFKDIETFYKQEGFQSVGFFLHWERFNKL